MASIDVGAAATDRAKSLSGDRTLLSLDNSADGDGSLTSIEIYGVSGFTMTGVIVATFYGSGTSWTPRDTVSLADVTGGSKVTRTVDASSNPIALSVETGDLIGIFFASGASLEYADSGGAGLLYKAGDYTASGTQTFSSAANSVMSLYATGETASATSIKTLFAGTPIADLAKFNGAAISDYKTINGISNAS